MKKATVLFNEQHKFLPQQTAVLDERFGEEGWEIVSVPAQGWTAKEQVAVLDRIVQQEETAVFASPIPYLLALLAAERGRFVTDPQFPAPRIFLFHNDKREKVEKENGQFFFRLIPEGWELKEICP